MSREQVIRQVYEDQGYQPAIIDELVQLSYDLAHARNITLDEAAAIVRKELARILKEGRDES